MTTTDELRSRLNDKPGVVGATITLHGGGYFDFIDPKPEMIRPEDIAWGLANTCRFGGQSLQYYSVAQHCILVSENLPDDLALAGLLHDAAEAYVGDMVGPLKQLCPDFRAIEGRVEAAVGARFGVTLPGGSIIKRADLRALRTEQRDLTSGHGDNWNGLDEFPPFPRTIYPWTPTVAARAWLRCFCALGGE